MRVPESANANPTIDSMSLPLSRKRADAIGLKQTAARFAGLRPSPVSSVIAAVVIANRRSSVAFSTLVRPKRASRNPTLDALQLALEPAQLLQPRLQWRVRREEAGRAALQVHRDDEELVQPL